jgi:sugar diacid utilization regulator
MENSTLARTIKGIIASIGEIQDVVTLLEIKVNDLTYRLSKIQNDTNKKEEDNEIV